MGAGGTAGQTAPAGVAADDRLPIPTRATGVELIGEQPGSGYRRPPALVRRADGQTLQLTPLLYRLLTAIDGERSYEQVAAEVSRGLGRELRTLDAAVLIETKLRPLGVLRRPDGDDPEVRRANPLLALRLKYVVTDPERTQRLTAPFAALFRPPIVLLVLTGFALSVWWVMFDKGLAGATHDAFHDPRLLLLVVGLTILSAGFHEFGHAAACRYGGATPGAMGAGLYLVWPAFYTEVTDSYRLGRWGRLRVDLGGLYFNAVFALAVVGAWWLTRWDALLLVVATQVLQMLRQLTPLVRFDGYHILADLTGVPDLFHHIKPILLGLLPHRWGRPEHRALKPWARAVVTLWVLTVVPVLLAVLGFLVWVLPRLIATAWAGLGVQREVLLDNLADGDLASVGVRILSILTLCIPVLSVGYLLLRITRRLWRRAVAASSGDPRKRLAVVLAGLLLLSGLAWAWWPGENYTAIGPDDRGTLTDLFASSRVFDDEREQPLTTSRARPATLMSGPRSGEVQRAAPPGASHQVAPARRGPLMVTIRHTPRPGLAVPMAPNGRWHHLAGARLTPLGLAGVLDGTSHGVRLSHLDGRLGTVVQAGAATARHQATSAETPATGRGNAPSAPPRRGGDGPRRGGEGPVGNVEDAARPSPEPDDWPFPWAPPPELTSGDNRAIAVVTRDERSVYDVSIAYAWITDGGWVEQSNEAWALASCVGCTAVAVAFQGVFVIGDVDVYVPRNSAVAATYECQSCTSHAVAVQLVATLTETPDARTMAQLQRVGATLQQLQGQVRNLTIDQIHRRLKSAELEILTILVDGGYLALSTTASASEQAMTPPEPNTSVASSPVETVEGDGEVAGSDADAESVETVEQASVGGDASDEVDAAATEDGSDADGHEEPLEEQPTPAGEGAADPEPVDEDAEHGGTDVTRSSDAVDADPDGVETGSQDDPGDAPTAEHDDGSGAEVGEDGTSETAEDASTQEGDTTGPPPGDEAHEDIDGEDGPGEELGDDGPAVDGDAVEPEDPDAAAA